MTDRSPRVVLIVEHDELLKSLTADIMEDAGFAALQAGDADEAVAIFESRSDIAVLLTSITMPSSMDGWDLAHAVCKRWPATKIVIASGKVCPIGHNLPVGSRFFLKPYRAQVMISEIRSLIGPGTKSGSWNTSSNAQKRAVLLRLASKKDAALSDGCSFQR